MISSRWSSHRFLPVPSSSLRRQLAAVVPGQRHGGPRFVGGELELDDRPLGIALLVVARRFGLDRDRVAQIEGHERHVDRVAGHVAQGAGAEIPEAAPGERMIAVAERPLWRGPSHRSQCRFAGPASGRPGRSAALRPDRAIGPDVNFLHRADRAGPNERGRLAQAAVGRALVAHLRGRLSFRGPPRPCRRAS